MFGASLLVALMVPGLEAGHHDSSGRHAGLLLERVIAHYQTGELERAWDAYRAFFNDPSNRNVRVNAFGRCFYQQECPALGILAYVLGKSETEAGNFRGFCPDWENLGIGDLDADELGESEKTMRGFRDVALGGSCADWATRMAAWFQPRPTDHRLVPQVISLLQPFSNDSRPYFELEILGTRTHALADTGATTSLLNRRWADHFPDAIELIDDVPMRYSDYEDSASLGRVSHVRLGNAVFSRPIVILEYMYWLESGELVPAELENLIGMNLLMQYDKVCFDWAGNKLHLGNLGPCTGGVEPDESWLTGPLGIAIAGKVSSKANFQVKIDTGATKTFCSQWLLKRSGERKTFSFGRSDALKGKCNYNPEVLFKEMERGEESTDFHVLLGMDTLRQFAAFGWQLNPLKVYFVPKPQGSDGSVVQDSAPHK